MSLDIWTKGKNPNSTQKWQRFKLKTFLQWDNISSFPPVRWEKSIRKYQKILKMSIIVPQTAMWCLQMAVRHCSTVDSFIFRQPRITDSKLSKITMGNNKKYTDTNDNYFYNYTRKTAGGIGAPSMLESFQTAWVLRSRNKTAEGGRLSANVWNCTGMAQITMETFTVTESSISNLWSKLLKHSYMNRGWLSDVEAPGKLCLALQSKETTFDFGMVFHSLQDG